MLRGSARPNRSLVCSRYVSRSLADDTNDEDDEEIDDDEEDEEEDEDMRSAWLPGDIVFPSHNHRSTENGLASLLPDLRASASKTEARIDSSVYQAWRRI